MLKNAQVSFFAIIGLFMVIITAGILTTTWSMGQSRMDVDIAKQSVLDEDRMLLEWQADEVIRLAALDAINDSHATVAEVEAGIAKLFNSTQFTRRGAEASIGYPSVKITQTAQYLIVDANFSIKLKRPWGEVGIEARSVRVKYNSTLE
jgi:hypothetical protein